MRKVFILVIFAIVSIGCRTAIKPVVKATDQSSIGLAENTEEPNTKVFPLLTDEQSRELQNRFNRHQSEANIEIVSGDEYQCKSKWTCQEDGGAWTCYCKTAKVGDP